ncbi:secreted protein [Melampsora americana]|nr:secreted protein [Melampsora americana]
MRNTPNLELKFIILTWVMAHSKLFVIGHPAMSLGKSFQLSEDLKGVGAASRGSKGFQDSQVIPDLSLQESNGLQATMNFRTPQISSGFPNPPTSSWFSGLAKFMNKFRGADPVISEAPKTSLKEPHGASVANIREDLLRFTPTPRTENAAPLVPEVNEAFKNQNVMVFKGQMEDMKPADVAELSPGRLIGYAADRNADVENKARNLYEVGDAYTQAERRAFYKASLAYRQTMFPSLVLTKGIKAKEYLKTQSMIRDVVKQKMLAPGFKGISEEDMTMSVRNAFIEKIAGLNLYPEIEKGLQDLKKARTIYQEAYTDTYQAALRLSKVDSLDPQTVAKLTDKQYVEKGALYDSNVYQRYAQWSGAEKQLDEILNDKALVTLLDSKFATRTKETEMITDRLKNKLIAKGKPIDDQVINSASLSEFIKRQASLNPQMKDLQDYASLIKKVEKQIETSKNAALKSADRYYTRQKLLKSTALRYKGWFSRNFKKAFN